MKQFLYHKTGCSPGVRVPRKKHMCLRLSKRHEDAHWCDKESMLRVRSITVWLFIRSHWPTYSIGNVKTKNHDFFQGEIS